MFAGLYSGQLTLNNPSLREINEIKVVDDEGNETKENSVSNLQKDNMFLAMSSG